MLFLGIDPDLHCLGYAVIDDTAKIVKVGALKIGTLIKGRDAVVVMAKEMRMFPFDANNPFAVGLNPVVLCVEAQELYRGAGADADTKNPRSIMLLASVAGAALTLPASVRYFPAPQEWKGNVPKQIHQARILDKFGLTPMKTSDYCYPKELPDGIKKADWKHVTDALGLALWAKEKWEMDQRKAKVLGK